MGPGAVAGLDALEGWYGWSRVDDKQGCDVARGLGWIVRVSLPGPHLYTSSHVNSGRGWEGSTDAEPLVTLAQRWWGVEGGSQELRPLEAPCPLSLFLPSIHKPSHPPISHPPLHPSQPTRSPHLIVQLSHACTHLSGHAPLCPHMHLFSSSFTAFISYLQSFF